eukprot:gene1186-1499_t
MDCKASNKSKTTTTVASTASTAKIKTTQNPTTATKLATDVNPSNHNTLMEESSSENPENNLITEIPQPTTTSTTNNITTTTTTTTTTSTSTIEKRNIVENLKPEVEYGNIEYKLKLVNPTEDRIEHLISQLKWRLGEGMGEAIYELGVEDDGTLTGLSEEDLNASLETLKTMASRLNADLTVIRERDCPKGKALEVLIRRFASDDFSEIRIGVVGNVDSGKSTLLGVLTRGTLDNGRGLARTAIFNHPHEVTTGRTSSISQEIVGFDSKGKIVNYNNSSIHNSMNPSEICELSSKIVNFIDLAGHEKYLKTTLFGMTGHAPDYAMLMIGANMGVVGMTKEHLGISLALRVPVFVVVTKIDRCPENVLTDTMNDIKKILKSPGSRKLPVVIRNEDDVVVAARNFVSERIAPIFCVSNVTGENLNLLRSFLNLLPAKKEWEALLDKPSQLDIDSIWTVAGAGTVVSGTVVKGIIQINDTLLIGPDESGAFLTTQVKSIHTKRLSVKQVKAGMTASIALKKIKKSQIRKGMILTHPSAKPMAVREFEAEVIVLYHSTTISKNYEAVVHCGATQQCAKILDIDKGVIRTGDKAVCRFRFTIRPEFLSLENRLIFREGKAKGVGKIVKLIPLVETPIAHPHPHPHTAALQIATKKNTKKVRTKKSQTTTQK